MEQIAKQAVSADLLWESIRDSAVEMARREPVLASYFNATILHHDTLEAALSFHLANKLDSVTVPAMLIREIIAEALQADPEIGRAVRADIKAVKDRDPACKDFATPFLYFKGFHSLQAYRIAHWLWREDRQALALFIQNQVSVVFGVDIHPAAQIGSAIMLDHGTGIVIGETSIIEDCVSILQDVTLGGTGKEQGKRHPTIRAGVMIGAGAKILGSVDVGSGAKVAAGSVVLHDVSPHTTVAGVPANVVGRPKEDQPAFDMDQCCTGKNI